MPTSQLPLWSEKDGAQGWVVRQSRRARRLAVRVFHTGRVEVVVPSRTSPTAVERFVTRHRGWIERKCEEARSRAGPAAPFPPARIEFPACHEIWKVHLAGGDHGARLTELGHGLLALSGDSTDGRAVRLALRRWLLQRAERVLEPALARLAQELGYEYQRVLIRRQRTRWGSCSTRGTISLNCCLMFQRPAVVHYLMIHELAHTLHMNHSRRFWQAVSRHCCAYRVLDRELVAGWRCVPSWVFGDEERHQS
ncbi:MAG TPA: SprT family zinc-dependent metalloprotease [Steroidobacteraceae bacterium]|nr:SprT family zinc-dependent metalloprotease [Steroidobacteraceae bacterium]